MKAVRNISFYMMAGLLPNLANLILLPIYTRLLDPSDFGLVSLVSTLMSAFGAVAGLQLASSVNRLYFEYKGTDLKAYVSTILYAILGINGVLLLLYHLWGPFLTHCFFPRVELPYRPYVLLGLMGLFFTTIVNLCKGLLRVQERAGWFLTGALSHVVIGGVLGVYFVVIRRMGAEGVLLASTLNSAIHAIGMLVPVRSLLGAHFRIPVLKEALRFSLPMVPHVMGLILFMYTDKYILSFYVSLGSVGLYDLAARLANVMRMITISFYAAINPGFMRGSQVDKVAVVAQYRAVIVHWTVFLMGMFLAVSLFAQEIIKLLAPEAYHEAYRLVPVLVAGLVFHGLQGFPTAAIMHEKKTKVFPYITVLAGIVNLVLNLLFVPRYGVVAAAWTTCFAYGITFFLSFLFSNRYYPLQYNWKIMFEIISLSMILLGLGWWVPWPSFLAGIVCKCGLLGVYASVIWWRNPEGMTGHIKRLFYSVWTRSRGGADDNHR